MTRYLTSEEIRFLHEAVMKDHGQSAARLSADKVESAAHRPQSESFGTELFPALSEKAAVLLHSLVSTHPFLDGNKRIGLAATIAFLKLNGVQSSADQDALYDLVIAVASGDMREVPEIAGRLRALFALSE